MVRNSSPAGSSDDPSRDRPGDSLDRPAFVSAYGPKNRVGITFPPEGGAKQSFKAECDINTIMARYAQTGILEHVSEAPGRYMDCIGADYQAAANFIASANSSFYGLPAKIRDRFDNNPALFLDAMDDPRFAQEAVELGLRAAEGVGITPAEKTQPGPVELRSTAIAAGDVPRETPKT